MMECNFFIFIYSPPFVIYGNGDGVLMDLEEAVKWCRLAAEQGHMEAIFKLGESYYLGTG